MVAPMLSFSGLLFFFYSCTVLNILAIHVMSSTFFKFSGKYAVQENLFEVGCSISFPFRSKTGNASCILSKHFWSILSIINGILTTWTGYWRHVYTSKCPCSSNGRGKYVDLRSSITVFNQSVLTCFLSVGCTAGRVWCSYARSWRSIFWQRGH